MGIAPHRVIPIDDIAIAVERSRSLRHHGRAEGFPAMLLFAHPLHAHRAAGDRAGNQRGVGGSIVGAVVAIAAGAFHVDAAHLFRRQSQKFGNGLAVRIDPLRVAPDRDAAVVRPRNRA